MTRTGALDVTFESHDLPSAWGAVAMLQLIVVRFPGSTACSGSADVADLLCRCNIEEIGLLNTVVTRW
jgi:hypothetical protein